MKFNSKFNQTVLTEIYLVNIFSIFGGFFYSFYYPIFLFREFENIENIIIDTLVASIFLWIGYLLGIIYSPKLGYISILKISFFIYSIASLLTLIFIDALPILYLYFAALRGIATGLNTAVIQTFLIKKINIEKAGEYFYVNLSISNVLNVILPVVVGILIYSTGSYQLSFLISFIIYMFIVLLPLNPQKVIDDGIQYKEIKNIFKIKLFTEISLNKILFYGGNSLNALFFAITPFLILKSELDIGILTSLTGILAGTLAFFSRKNSQVRQVRLGYLGSLSRLMVNIPLVILWNSPALYFRNLIVSGVTIFTDPILEKTNLKIQKQFLGSHLIEYTQEINIIDATYNFLGKMVALFIFLLVIQLLPYSQEDLIKIGILIFAVWRIIHFWWIEKLEKNFDSKYLEK